MIGLKSMVIDNLNYVEEAIEQIIERRRRGLEFLPALGKSFLGFFSTLIDSMNKEAKEAKRNPAY